MARILLLVTYIVPSLSLCAQEPLSAHAGEDKHFCPSGMAVDTAYLILGDTHAATGGTPPYTYRWFTDGPVITFSNSYSASSILNDTTFGNPVLNMGYYSEEPHGMVRLYLEVTDSTGVTAIDFMEYTQSTFMLHLGSISVYAQHGDTVSVHPVANSDYPLVKWFWADSVDFIDPASSPNPRILCQYGSTLSTYAVTVYDSMNCSFSGVSEENIIVRPLVIKEPSTKEVKLRIWPNPASSSVTLSGDLYDGSVIIYNQLAQEVYQSGRLTTDQYLVSTEFLPTGVYNVTVKKNAQMVAVKRLVVKR